MTQASSICDQSEELEILSDIAVQLFSERCLSTRATTAKTITGVYISIRSNIEAPSKPPTREGRTAHNIGMRLMDRENKLSKDIGKLRMEYVAEYCQVFRDYCLPPAKNRK